QSSASSLSSGEYLPGSLQGKISSDGCLKKEQMVVSAIASTPHTSFYFFYRTPSVFSYHFGNLWIYFQHFIFILDDLLFII
ncbi:hypothetical protein, partial [Escherichia coli]|uniref:hypothetical protein n=1 Tax=Escherichia coli TaxID=562 RepID=UPI001A7E055A